MALHQGLGTIFVLTLLHAAVTGFLVDDTGRTNSTDGGWAAWIDWSDCHVTCGHGNRTRTRSCDNPTPLNVGAVCPGLHEENKTCSMTACPVHGSWGLWSPWGTCSTSCGPGLERRDRYFNHPFPSSSGEYCYGEGLDYRPCMEAFCSAWTPWSPWSPCSNTFGYGLKRQERNCTGAPHEQINLCPEEAHEYDSCETKCHQRYGCEDTIEICFTLNNSIGLCTDVAKASVVCPKFCDICPIDGGWAAWTDWSDLSRDLWNGNRTRTRSCDDPTPLNGGAVCPGSHEETKTCSMNPCPVQGSWGLWTQWGTCSVTCGTGLERRDRYCNSPNPSSSGEHCYGEGNDYRICTETSRSAWTPRSLWSPCSNTCGYGLKRRERNCTGAPSGQINVCTGDAHENNLCEIRCHQLYVESTSAFTARNIATYSGNDMRFTDVVLNQGGDYNSTTGYFTCRIPSIYQFSANFEKTSSSSDTYCYILLNGEIMLNIRPSYSSRTYETASASIALHLNINDVVNVGGCSGLASFYTYRYSNMFTGHLIAKDN